jgi:3-deoxy-manno-octulosonate cytidylyltransferase (CMP-KDO synthetase)
MKPLIIIPARIGSTRLKNKPLRKVAGVPLVTHACLRALEADIGPVVLSTDDERVARCAPKGVKAWVAKNFIEHCGSDRVAFTAQVYEGDYTHVINLQADMPFIQPELIRAVWARRRGERLPHPHQIWINNPDVVTAQHHLEYVHWGSTFIRSTALQHIGIYAFTTKSLGLFASLGPSPGEREQLLEGCRITEHGMTIQTVNWPSMPFEVNTEADLEHANSIAEAIWRSDDARPRDRGVGAAAAGYDPIGLVDWDGEGDRDPGPD